MSLAVQNRWMKVLNKNQIYSYKARKIKEFSSFSSIEVIDFGYSLVPNRRRGDGQNLISRGRGLE